MFTSTLAMKRNIVSTALVNPRSFREIALATRFLFSLKWSILETIAVSRLKRWDRLGSAKLFRMYAKLFHAGEQRCAI